MDKIKAVLVLEVLGKPAEHIKSALVSLVEKLAGETGIKVIDKKIHEPVPVQEAKDLFTTFAEVTVEFDSLTNCFGILFAYMPANIEIISPASLTLQNVDFNDLANKLLARLHDYDAITKKFVYERNFLLTKLHEKAPELFRKPEAESKQPSAPVKEEEGKKENKKPAKKAQK